MEQSCFLNYCCCLESERSFVIFLGKVSRINLSQNKNVIFNLFRDTVKDNSQYSFGFSEFALGASTFFRQKYGWLLENLTLFVERGLRSLSVLRKFDSIEPF